MNDPIENYSERFTKTEKIDGKIYLMAAPCDEHIDVQDNLNRIFNNYFKRNKRRCRARNEAKTDIDEETYVKPDVKVLCRETRDDDIPVIIIEVLSNSTRLRDLGIKMVKYAQLGVKEYWIVTWETCSVDIYLLGEDNQYKLHKSYVHYVSEEELKRLDDDELDEVVKHFSPVSFPELIIKLEDVFDIFV